MTIHEAKVLTQQLHKLGYRSLSQFRDSAEPRGRGYCVLGYAPYGEWITFRDYDEARKVLA